MAALMTAAWQRALLHSPVCPYETYDSPHAVTRSLRALRSECYIDLPDRIPPPTHFLLPAHTYGRRANKIAYGGAIGMGLAWVVFRIVLPAIGLYTLAGDQQQR